MAKGLSFMRGDLVLAAASGDYGKPRPCLVIQSDLFAGLPSITICPLTSDLRNDAPLVRLTVQPDEINGLRKPSQIAIDKITTLPLARFGGKIGEISDVMQLQVTRAIAVFLGVG
jgi:mRNA interferase MazF